MSIDVLVVGAGPTGLTMAVEALRHGLTCRIIERKSSRAMNQSKALVIHARTMEQLHAMGSPNERGRVTKRLCEAGTKFAKLRAFIGTSGDHNKEKSHTFDEDDENWGDTDFPFWLIVPQYRTECILEDELERLGGHVEWSTSLQTIQSTAAADQFDDHNAKEYIPTDQSYVTVLTARTSKDASENDLSDNLNAPINCRWLIGCDGGRSVTREKANLVLERDKSSNELFYLADVEFGSERAKEFFKGDEGNLFIMRPEGIMAILPVGEDNLFRIIAQETDLKDSDNFEIDKAFIDRRVQKRCGINIDTKRIAWSGTFKATYGVSDAYYNGMGIFVAGDAAHVHSPIGGQGMNFGLQDAVNLMWKLAWVKRIINSSSMMAQSGTELKMGQFRSSIESILNSYDCERREAALDMIGWNTISTKRLVSKNPVMQRIRNVGMKLIFGGNRFRRVVSNSLSMINLQYNSAKSPIIMKESKKYRLSPTSLGCFSKKVSLKPGSRLPNFITCDRGKIYDIVDRSRHSWLILSTDNNQALNELKQNGKSEGPGELPLFVAPLDDPQFDTMLPRCLLIRPDMFIAAVGEDVHTIWRQFVSSFGDGSSFM